MCSHSLRPDPNGVNPLAPMEQMAFRGACSMRPMRAWVRAGWIVGTVGFAIARISRGGAQGTGLPAELYPASETLQGIVSSTAR